MDRRRGVGGSFPSRKGIGENRGVLASWKAVTGADPS